MDREEAIRTVRLCCPKISNSECDFETAMRVLVPELAESEDERIRKELLKFLDDMANRRTRVSTTDQAKCWYQWLEKQKVNTDGDFARGYDCGYEACLHSHGAEWFEKQKVNKKDLPVWRLLPYNDRGRLREWGLMWCDDFPGEPAYANALTDGRYIISLEDLEKLQKEDEPIPGTTPDNPIDPFDTKLFQDGVKEGLRLAKEEMIWSEEDEEMRNAVIVLLENTSAIHPVFSSWKLIDWLKALGCHPYWRPTQKQIDAISEVMSLNPSADLTTTLGTLYCELKRLKED